MTMVEKQNFEKTYIRETPFLLFGNWLNKFQFEIFQKVVEIKIVLLSYDESSSLEFNHPHASMYLITTMCFPYLHNNHLHSLLAYQL
jgi:hypothetical protein